MLAAGACTPRDVADAILRDMNADDGVIDVGANRGYPVSRLALTRSAPWLLSVEPDARNFATLSKLKRDKRTRYLAVNGAASSEKGEAEIAFHKDRDDFTCFHCLDKSKAEVSTKKVHVYTVTELVARLHPQVLLKSTSGSSKGVRILLFKTDTQGHEGSVLIGAREVMGFVRNVLMEFDPKLLRSKENAMAVMKELFDARFECVQLKFAGKLTEGYVSSFQGRRVISRGTAGEFYDSVVKSGAYTDVFCSKR